MYVFKKLENQKYLETSDISIISVHALITSLLLSYYQYSPFLALHIEKFPGRELWLSVLHTANKLSCHIA